jgi:ubiquinol-cytochrome c reductase cytochrome b subunit
MKAMCRKLSDWLDDRTGYRDFVNEALYENIPGGSRWIYITGSMLVFAFVTQLVTGVFLWMFYSASSQNAWESVYWIQNKVQGGWFLRGIHHYMAQAMVVLLPLHLLQVLLCKAYVKPREINYWLGLVLMLITLGLGLTGYLLPWDQKGYWATKVATELVSLGPAGQSMQKVVVGGSEYGHNTLTRFFALHAGVLPGLLIMVLGMHVMMFRKHGITAKSSAKREDEYFWPKQVFKDSAGCLLLLLAVGLVVIYKHGADLGPPAEPNESYGAARPEWYYLFLFQLLKIAPNEFIGAIVIPGVVVGFLFALPLVAKVKHGHVVNVAVVVSLMISAAYLTYSAMSQDNYAKTVAADPDSTDLLHLERLDASEKFWLASELSDQEYRRVERLVEYFGIPKQGANAGLVANDPEIQGPRIFLRNCQSCHSYVAPEGAGVVSIPGPKPPRDDQGKLVANPEPYGGPNLYGIGTPDWFRKILDPKKFASADMFGLTEHKDGEMATFVADELGDLSDEQKKTLELMVTTLSAEAKLVTRRVEDEFAKKDGTIEKGIAALSEAIDSQSCLDCHQFHGEGEQAAPDLTGYGSHQWLYDFIANPAHAEFYPDSNDRMPAFAAITNSVDASENLLSHHDIDMLVRWLRGDDRDVKVGERESLNRALLWNRWPDPPARPEVETPEEPLGQRLFRRKCARCHSHSDENGEGIVSTKPSAPNLHGFASRKWITGLLNPNETGGPKYFGNTKHSTMADDVTGDLVDLEEDEQAALDAIVIAVSAEAKLPSQIESDKQAIDAGIIKKGIAAFVDQDVSYCSDCHNLGDSEGDDSAADLTGYGSREWLIEFITDPTQKRFYGEKNDRMPKFGASMSSEEIEAIVDWLRQP